MTPYQEFNKRLALLISKNPNLITTTLSNIFTMRLIGNKTHGDLAEIAIAEFINQYMYDFNCVHVGKLKFRSKFNEEDIQITNEITNELIPVSLKAFGHGSLQLSTDKQSLLFNSLEKHLIATGSINLQALWEDPAFSNFGDVNILSFL